MEPFLRAWLQEGVVGEWRGRLVTLRGGETTTPPDRPRYVGVPGMGSLAAHLAQDLEVRSGRRVSSVEPMEESGEAGPGRDRWRLIDDSGAPLGEFGAVLVSVPPPQAVPLLDGAPELAEAVSGIRVAPCWSLMVSFESPVPVDFDGAFLEGAAGDGSPVEPLAWVARDGSKPARPEADAGYGAGEDAWVLHAGPEWSSTHLPDDPEEVTATLLRAFATRFGALPEVRFAKAHLWRYARPLDRAGPGALYDVERRIGVCGDALQGGRIEGALLTGRAVAGRLLGEAPAAPGNPLGEGPAAPRRQLALGL
jgi:predicted NAD/FAD-dependent oxidoreductase